MDGAAKQLTKPTRSAPDHGGHDAGPAPGRIGDSMLRVEDTRLITGAGAYTDDVALPGMLHGAFVRSPHAHALIRGVDRSPLPEGVTLFTAEDLVAAGVGPIPNPVVELGAGYASYTGTLRPVPPWYPLANGKVRHVGEAVALVVAPTAAEARDVADQLAVDYEVLPAAVDMTTADAPDAAQIWDQIPQNIIGDYTAGDAAATAAAFARAKHVVELEVTSNRVIINFLEPRACVAAYDETTGRVTVYVGSQGANVQAERIAETLGIPRDKIRVITGDVGGAFGARTTTYPEPVACAHAARVLRRPVKWLGTRSEGFVSDTQGRDNIMRGALALDESGRILALRAQCRCAMGAHVGPRQPAATVANLVRMFTGAYAITAAQLDIKAFVTNTAPVNVYRGVGRLEDQFLIERLLDRAAAAIGIDRVEIRRRNLVPADAMPWTTPTGSVYDCGDFAHVLDRALAEADWFGFPARRKAAAKRGRLRGIGISCIIEGAGGTAEEYAAVEVLPDGTVRLGIGAQSQGQGHETAFAQVIAELLDVPVERVTVLAGDTDKVAGGVGTFASRSMIKAGGATFEAGHKLLADATERAARRLEADIHDIEYRGGRFVVVGTDRAVTLGELAGEARLFADRQHFNEQVAWPNGSHVCEVEIDPETGALDIVRYVAVDDVGRAINPMIVHGQTIGAVAQGLGQALMENCVYEPGSGQLLSGSFMDYAMPRARNMPNVETWLENIPTATNPLGVKGAGEAGTVAAPCAAISAILDALAPLGVTHIEMPATAERIWTAIQAAQDRDQR